MRQPSTQTPRRSRGGVFLIVTAALAACSRAPSAPSNATEPTPSSRALVAPPTPTLHAPTHDAAHVARAPETSDASNAPAAPGAAVANGGAGGDAAVAAVVPDAAAPTAPSTAGGASSFLGGDETASLRRVCNAAVARIERNRGGSTISFRVWFDGGARGLFKPQQRNEVANFRAELGAYRLSRLLGLNRVPPGCGRTMPRDQLQHIADASGDADFSTRVMRELLARGDEVPGAMLFWVPGPLEPVVGTDRWPALLDPTQPLAPEDEPLAADLARLILFDFVTDNVDRWSGGNILRQHPAAQPPGPMLFMDNGAAFSAGNDGMGARPRDQASRLARVGRLPRAMVAALRALTAESLAAAMREDPLGSVLSDAQMRAVLARRDRVLEHVDALVRERGEAAVFVFP